MRIAEVTFTVRVTKRVGVPSCLSLDEVRAMAFRTAAQYQARAAVHSLLADPNPPVPPFLVDVKLSEEDGLMGEDPELGIGGLDRFSPWGAPHVSHTDEDYEKVSGRAPPAEPSQMQFFDRTDRKRS